MKQHRTLLAFAILFMLGCSPPNTPFTGELLCDAEQLTFNGSKFKSSNGHLLKGGKNQSTEQAFSGKYSIRLSPENAYGMGYTIEQPEPESYYEVSVKRYGKEGFIVADTPDKRFYVTNDQTTINSHQNGWETLKLGFHVPPNIDNTPITIYLWNPGEGVVYFDDLHIQQLPSKTYPDFAIAGLQLLVEDEQVAVLEQVRKGAFDKGYLDVKEWVPAQMIYQQDTFLIKLRLKGDNTDHLYGKKWSFRVKTKEQYWKGMKEFSLHTPSSRSFVDEWVLHELFRKEDILTTRYGFVPVSINGNNIGLYAFEEHFEKELLTANNRPNAPIVKMDDTDVWAVSNYNLQGHDIHLPTIEAATTPPFNKKKVLSNPELRQQYYSAQQLVWNYKWSTHRASEVFEVEALARYFALIDLSGAYHALGCGNQRFYFNDEQQKLEPIGYDGYIQSGVYNFTKRPLYGHIKYHHPHRDIYRNDALFTDTLFVDRYLFYLHQYASESYINDFMSALKPSIAQWESLIQLEFDYYQYQHEFMPNRAAKVRNALKEMETLVAQDYFTALQHLRVDTAYTRNYPMAFVPFMVKAYNDHYSADSTTLSVWNFNSANIIVTHTVARNGRMHKLGESVIIPAYQVGQLPRSTEIRLQNSCELVGLTTANGEEIEVKVMPWKSPILSDETGKAVLQ